MTGSLGSIHVPEQVVCAISDVLRYLKHRTSHICGRPVLFWNKSWTAGRVPPTTLDTDGQTPESQTFFFSFSGCNSFNSSFSFGDLVLFFPWNMCFRSQATCLPLYLVPGFTVQPSLSKDHEHFGELCYICLEFRYFPLAVLFYIFMCKTAGVSISPSIPSQNSWGDGKISHYACHFSILRPQLMSWCAPDYIYVLLNG